VREDKLWPALCKAVERADLPADPRFQTTDKRRTHAAELAAILDPIFAAQPWPEWKKRLRHNEITFGHLGVMRDVPHDGQAAANGAVPARRRVTASTPTRCWLNSATAKPSAASCGSAGLEEGRGKSGKLPKTSHDPGKPPMPMA